MAKPAFRVRFEIQDLDNCLQVDRTVNVREQLVGLIRTRLIPDLGHEPQRVNDQQYQSVLAGEERIGNAQDLVRFGAMDEALDREAIGSVGAN
jgi:hypothetical protein